MRYIIAHITTIIDTYRGEEPLAHFLKNYFKQHPILGSRDRKLLSAMAYSWYRCEKGIVAVDTQLSLEQKLVICLSLCGNEVPTFLSTHTGALDPEFIKNFNSASQFPHHIDISDGITKADWLQSMLSQPNLFIRVRRDLGKITSLLNGAKIPYTFASDNCLSLPNGAKIDTLLPQDAYVVQDASSQKTGEWFVPRKHEYWYDCCSGAGGKSLLLKDLQPTVRLTITDKRETIIYNLQKRFRLYRHELPAAHITDASDSTKLQTALTQKRFDNIICDAPCSGSGTWARTPEQLYFFKPETLNKFSSLQTTIATNVADYLKPGGRLLYITCSVFKQENEQVVESIMKHTGLSLVRSEIINGISIHADSMFIAELRKPE